MATSHGSKASFWVALFGTPGVADQDASTFVNSVGNSLNRDTAETTTMKKGSKTYIPGLKDGTVPFEGPYDTAIDGTFWDLFNNGTIILWEYYPAGKAVSGTPKFSGQGFITTYEVTSDVGDANAMSGELQITGDVTRVVQ